LIDAPLYEDGRTIPRGEQQKALFSSIVEEAMYGYIIEALKDRAVIKQKGELAMQRIEREHDLGAYTRKMEDIYNTALA
ncbi:MAG: hypothetical protein ABUT20_60970, partial [Bacteroidota bacterium]